MRSPHKSIPKNCSRPPAARRRRPNPGRAPPLVHPHTAPQAFGEHGAGADEATLLASLGRRLEARAAAASVSLPAGGVDGGKGSALSLRLELVDMLGTTRDETAAALALAGGGRLLRRARAILNLGGEIGSVLVGETFVADGAGGVCALSGAMSEYGAWRAGGAEHENAEELLDLAKEHAERLAVRAAGNTQPLPPPAEQPALGALIAAPVVRCALVCASLPPLDATLYPFEHGALLAQPRLGAVWLPFSGHGAPASVALHDDGAAARAATAPTTLPSVWSL